MGREDAFLSSRFPISRACASLIHFVGLPVRGVVFLLILFARCNQDGESAVGVVHFLFLVRVFFHRILRTYRVARNERSVMRDALVVVRYSNDGLAKPASGGQGASASLMALTLRTAWLSIAPRRDEVNSTFLVKPVVANGSSGHVLVGSFLFRLLRGFTRVVIRANSRAHGLYVRVNGNIVSKSFLAAGDFIVDGLYLVVVRGEIFQLRWLYVQRNVNGSSRRELFSVLFLSPFRHFLVGRVD